MCKGELELVNGCVRGCVKGPFRGCVSCTVGNHLKDESERKGELEGV